MDALGLVHTLTFDAFGTILDLGGSRSPRFDAVGARASGYRAAYVNRYDLPYDETPYQFDIEARDFLDLADTLGCK